MSPVTGFVDDSRPNATYGVEKPPHLLLPPWSSTHDPHHNAVNEGPVRLTPVRDTSSRIFTLGGVDNDEFGFDDTAPSDLDKIVRIDVNAEILSFPIVNTPRANISFFHGGSLHASTTPSHWDTPTLIVSGGFLLDTINPMASKTFPFAGLAPKNLGATEWDGLRVRIAAAPAVGGESPPSPFDL